MPFNAFPVTRFVSRTGGGRRVETREQVRVRNIEALVVGLAHILYDYVWASGTGRDDKPSLECVNGLRAINATVFEAILATFKDYENDGWSGKRMARRRDQADEAMKRAIPRFANISETDISAFARSTASFLWSIREKNLLARSAVARILATNGSLLGQEFDQKNGIAQSNTPGRSDAIMANDQLCDESEGLSAESDRKGAWVTVDTHLRFKFIGRPVALCTNSFRNAHGQVFVKGVYYSADEKTKAHLVAEYANKGRFQVDVHMPDAIWHVMRSYNKNNLSWFS